MLERHSTKSGSNNPDALLQVDATLKRNPKQQLEAQRNSKVHSIMETNEATASLNSDGEEMTDKHEQCDLPEQEDLVYISILEMETDEKDAQEDYELFMKDSAEKYTDDSKVLTAGKGDLAEVEKELLYDQGAIKSLEEQAQLAHARAQRQRASRRNEGHDRRSGASRQA